MALCLVGCTVGDGGESGEDTPAVTTAVPGDTADSTEDTEMPADSGPPACVSGDVAFAADGVVAAFGGDGGDAGIVSGLRWSITEVCERFVIDLATEGGSPAATVGRTTVELRPDTGILRISLPEEVEMSAVSRTVVDGRMVAAAYAVELTGGTVAVDLHLDALGGIEARAFLASSPARIVVDLRPVTSAAGVAPPAGSAETVLLAPQRGTAGYPLEITGYVAPRVGQVIATLGVGSAEARTVEVTLAESDNLWKEFTARVTDGPTGTVDLVVVSTRDGEPVDELTVPLDVS